MRISDWSSDVCSSDLDGSIFYCCGPAAMLEAYKQATAAVPSDRVRLEHFGAAAAPADTGPAGEFTVVLAKRSEEHTSELQSLMRISYAVFCLKKKRQRQDKYKHHYSH